MAGSAKNVLLGAVRASSLALLVAVAGLPQKALAQGQWDPSSSPSNVNEQKPHQATVGQADASPSPATALPESNLSEDAIELTPPPTREGKSSVQTAAIGSDSGSSESAEMAQQPSETFSDQASSSSTVGAADSPSDNSSNQSTAGGVEPVVASGGLDAKKSDSLFRKWYFWVTVGAIAASAVTITVLAFQDGDEATADQSRAVRFPVQSSNNLVQVSPGGVQLRF